MKNLTASVWLITSALLISSFHGKDKSLSTVDVPAYIIDQFQERELYA